ncbi:hypothetical protein like AT1G14710 [Hibiscus trionum]|uniref:Hydroxyproline-rich glycoprotein family protein n=1 Tax=Hibiscus trionum TaxID=183268 RepID=A0A9W7M0A2_HIBTR|nr:hypothetical protein like AT1G14710 [Hibiscus trionum]
MAVPSGNVVLSDKMPFPAPSAAGAGGGVVFNQQHHQNWFPDERDGFIYWLRGEFAAANAMIDAICNHLREVGEAGEYEAFIACIQQRRCHWNSVLHMQQFFSINEVSYALQQVAWRRRQMHYDHVKVGGKEFKRSGFGFKGHRIEGSKEMQNSEVDCDGNSTFTAVSERNEKGSEKREEFNSCVELGKDEDKCPAVTEDRKEHDSHPAQNQNEKQNLALHPKTFVGNEMFYGKMVNVVDGLKLYDKLFDEKEVSNLVSLVNDLRVAGKRGQFQGQTYVASRKPMKGHGREIIQLGLPIVDAPLDDETAVWTSKVDRRIEAIPSLLQDAIERLVDLQVITAKPDSCIIDVYNEGDHSPPRMWPPWFGKHTFILFLTECDITFGRFIGIDHPGDFKGSLKLSLAPGSLLMMEGKSADFAKHALPSVRKQRMLSSQRGPPSSRSPNHFRHSAGPKHYAAIPTTGVLPATGIRPQIPLPNVVQPLFVPTPVALTIPFPAPVPIPPGSTGWSAGQRHFSPHLPIPGTRVFLPPPGSNSLPQQLSTIGTELNLPVETTSPPENNNGSVKPIHHATFPREKCDRKSLNQGYNGRLDKTSNGRAVILMKEEQQCNDNSVKQTC